MRYFNNYLAGSQKKSVPEYRVAQKSLNLLLKLYIKVRCNLLNLETWFKIRLSTFEAQQQQKQQRRRRRRPTQLTRTNGYRSNLNISVNAGKCYRLTEFCATSTVNIGRLADSCRVFKHQVPV